MKLFEPNDPNDPNPSLLPKAPLPPKRKLKSKIRKRPQPNPLEPRPVRLPSETEVSPRVLTTTPVESSSVSEEKVPEVRLKKPRPQESKQAPPPAKVAAAEQYYLVMWPSGENPHCETYSTLELASAAFAEESRKFIPSDVRAFMFVGRQLHIPMVDEMSVDLVIIGMDGKKKRVFENDHDPDRSNMKTGVIFKPVEDMLAVIEVPETEGFTFD